MSEGFGVRSTSLALRGPALETRYPQLPVAEHPDQAGLKVSDQRPFEGGGSERSGLSLEVARALHFQRRQRDALGLVLLAEAKAPDQVRRHFLTHALMHEWIRSRCQPIAGVARAGPPYRCAGSLSRLS
jgi:hypothetical protein